MPTFIYALKDPETRKIRYIGKTSRPETRLQKHLADRCQCHRVCWIQGLKNRGLRPEMELLVLVPPSEASVWEVKFIATARSLGLDLVNGTAGGEGCFSPTPETRVKMGDANRGRKRTEETRAKCRAGQLGKKHSPEARANMGAAQLGRRHPQETRDKQSAAAKAQWAARRAAR